MKATQSKKSVAVSLLAFGGILFSLAFCGARDAGAQQISSLPATISQPGSYYLSQNLTHTDRYSNAITVSADNVTIDLKGYALLGPDAALGTSNGIYMNGRSNVEIRNGAITDFGNCGIFEQSAEFGSGHRVIDVRILSNGGHGIELSGTGHTIKNCTVIGNCFALTQGGYGGITCGWACTVVGNVASYNYISGINTSSGCTISDNTVSGNGYGISVWAGCNVICNTVSYNYDDGIQVGSDGCLVKGNTCPGNGARGIEVSGLYNSIEENLVTYCQVGIYFANAQNYYANNRAMGNGTNYGGSLPTGTGNGGGNAGFGTLPANMSAQLEMTAGQTFNSMPSADE